MFPVRGHRAGPSRPEGGVWSMCQAGWDGMRGALQGTAGCSDRQAAGGSSGSVTAARGKGGGCPEPGTGRILRSSLPGPVATRATWPHCLLQKYLCTSTEERLKWDISRLLQLGRKPSFKRDGEYKLKVFDVFRRAEFQNCGKDRIQGSGEYGVLGTPLLEPGAVAESGIGHQKHKEDLLSRRSVFSRAHF